MVFFFWAALAEVVIAAVGLAFLIQSQEQSIGKWSFRAQRCKDLVKDGWPLLLSGLAVVGYMRLDIVMLGELAGDREAGIYSAATRISEAWYFVPISIVTAVFPKIVAAKQTNEATYIYWVNQVYSLLAWSALVVALVLSVIVEPMVATVFGEPYLRSAAVLRLHVWAGIPVSLGVASSQYLVAENLTRISLYRTAIGLLINATLNLILIPPYGAHGAAIATVVSFFASAFSLAFFKATRSHSKLLLQSLSIASLKRLSLALVKPDR